MSKLIIVADDHPLFRSAISNLLDRVIKVCNVKEVNCFEALTSALNELDSLPCLVILDLKLPDVKGLDGLLLLKKQYAELPIAIISAYDDANIIQQTKDYGASGFISKGLEMDDIAKAISSILEGDLYFPDTVNESPNQKGFEQLTPAQINVLKLLKEGKPTKIMASIMGVTEATIKAHLTTIYKKLGVKNRTQAVITANKLNLSDSL